MTPCGDGAFAEQANQLPLESIPTLFFFGTNMVYFMMHTAYGTGARGVQRRGSNLTHVVLPAADERSPPPPARASLPQGASDAFTVTLEERELAAIDAVHSLNKDPAVSL